jgi:hypothetical protein
MVDDGARFIVFSPRQVRDVDDKNLAQGTEVLRWGRVIDRRGATGLSSIVEVLDVTPWNDAWERDYTVQTPFGQHKVRQRLVELNPHSARIEATRYIFSAGFLTRELSPDTLRFLLYRHPDLLDKNGRPDPARRFRIYRFLVQAGHYDLAEDELNQLVRDLPDQKAKVEEARTGLNRLRVVRLVDEIEKMHQAGQHQAAQQKLERFPKEEDERLLARVRLLRDRYEKRSEDLGKARRYLALWPARAKNRWFAPAADALLQELTYDNVERLEKFINLSAQVEREAAQGQTPSLSPDELLALAVSGWLLGNVSAESKPEVADRLWRARELVLEYQRTTSAPLRKRMAESYEQAEGRIEIDELAQVIRHLPPPAPEKELPTRPFELETDPALTGARIRYAIRLPPEYHHGRAFPVLIALHHAGEKPVQMLERLAEAAGQYGYLLVAPDWQRGPNYGYTAEEHLAVTAVLADLCRRFQVDNDCVFLAGYGDGANMAYDVGLSHPDLFAGVLPMCALPRYFPLSYWRNGPYLPFYVVTGDYAGDSPKWNRKLFDHWVPKGYPSLYVEYKGRPMEWFAAEVPYWFDWMSRKKRADPIVEVGRSPGATGEEFQSLRESDNRFYWISGDIQSRHVNDPSSFNYQTIPAGVQARVFEANQINVNLHGFQNLTIWLGRGMIDFAKPVTVRFNTLTTWNSGGKPIPPSFHTLLEDFYQRSDRQRLFLAKIVFDKVPS